MIADPATLKILLGIQELDRQLDRLAHDRANLPELAEIATIDDGIARRERAGQPLHDRRHELGRDQKRLEDEVALLEARIEAENGKLYGGAVTAIKELQALQDEIAGLTSRQRIVEDQILEVMEAIEPVDAELAQLDVLREADLAGRAVLEDVVEQRRREIDAEATAIRERRDADVPNLPAALMAEYERLRARPGQVAVARLVGTTCHGCHLDLAAVEVDRLKKLPQNDLVHCDECGCILVR